MSPDPAPPAPAGETSPRAPEARPADRLAALPTTAGSGATGAGAGSRRHRVDESMWCRWWRDLIVERYRLASFDEAVPLPDGDRCAWRSRVALGRVVERSLAGAYGTAATSRLVVDALEAAGFGVAEAILGPATGDLGGATRWATPPPGDVDLRAGILGTIADALLGALPPTAAGDDPGSRRGRAEPGTDGAGDPDAADIDALVRGATRHAVLAYAGHVEHLAERSLRTSRGLRSLHERGGARPFLVR